MGREPVNRILQILATLLTLALLAGCANNPWREREAKSFYESQQKLLSERKPLFELKAQPGQVIMLTGVESLTVNDPREAQIQALPQQRSPVWDTLNTVLRIGAQAYGAKVASDGVVAIVEHATRNAGDHSVTTVTGSYNTQGDTLTGSIGGSVTGNGSGIGNAFTHVDRSVAGDGNAVDVTAGRDVNLGDRNGNSGRQDSPDDDHSDPGNDCSGEQCQSTGASDGEP